MQLFHLPSIRRANGNFVNVHLCPGTFLHPNYKGFVEGADMWGQNFIHGASHGLMMMLKEN